MGTRGCDQGGGFKDSKGWGEVKIMQDGTVDSQHGTGMDEIRNHASKATYSSKGSFKVYRLTNLLYLNYFILYILNYSIFFSSAG
jgi:hypothetical protein